MTDAAAAASPAAVRTFARPACPVCAGAGRPLHRNLVDSVWGVGGTWTLHRCAASTCRTLWLDPAPVASDLARLYATYSTHADSAAGGRSWLADAKTAAIARHWGYPARAGGPVVWLLDHLLSWSPQQRARIDASVGYVRGDRPGRWLDVGCGAGATLERMRGLGWETEGVDPDPQAVAVARARGLDVRCGTLLERPFERERFDAVSLTHVVEHLHDPAAVLAECLRVMKPGASLVLQTPNAASWLHRWFGAAWRGLEPPRHLQVFTPTSLARLARDAGFEVARAFTTAKSASFFFAASAAARRAGRRGEHSRDEFDGGLRRAGGLAAAIEVALAPLAPGRGEELVLVARKPAARR